LDAVLSVTAAEAVPVKTLSFTVNQYSLVDARYLATTVNQAPCTISPDETIPTIPQLLLISSPTLLLVSFLYIMIAVVSGRPLICRSMILSQSAAVPVKRNTVTIVRPPFDAMFKLRGPASRYCELVRLKVTWPLPCGPPDALYTGRMAEPTGHNWHDTEANEGFAGTRAKNLAQTVFEYIEVALPPEHLNPHSILHEAEQPSPAAVLLSSQKFAVLVSAPIVLPSPHIGVQFD